MNCPAALVAAVAVGAACQAGSHAPPAIPSNGDTVAHASSASDALVERVRRELTEGRPEEALEAAAAAARIGDERPLLDLLRGYAFSELGRDAEAEAAFRSVLDSSAPAPFVVSAHLGLVAIHARRGETDIADAHSRRALAIDPSLQALLLDIERERTWRPSVMGSNPGFDAERTRRLLEAARDLASKGTDG